jgi:ribonuclease HI
MATANISWKRMRFKSNKVWLALDANGAPLCRNDKVLIKYQVDQDYEYWVHPASLQPLDAAEPLPPKRRGKAAGAAGQKTIRKPSPTPRPEAAADDTVVIYTDGASSGNPGPSGIGVILRLGDHEKEISQNIGIATNNIAELEAIRAGLSEMKRTDVPVRLYTDSSYAHGLLVLGWKAKKNKELVASIRRLMTRFRDLEIIRVRGHQGVEGNERADQLATAAAAAPQTG